MVSLPRRHLTRKGTFTSIQKIGDVLNGGTYAIISTVILLVVLFADDIRQIAFPVSADLGFTILTLCCMIYYMTEIVILCLVQVNFF